MILLHHPESELSRALLASLPEGVEVVDWTLADPSAWGGPAPSAFPSVLVDVPAHAQDQPRHGPDSEFLGMARVNVPAGQELLRLPAGWAAVESFRDFVQARAETAPPAEQQE